MEKVEEVKVPGVDPTLVASLVAALQAVREAEKKNEEAQKRVPTGWYGESEKDALQAAAEYVFTKSSIKDLGIEPNDTISVVFDKVQAHLQWAVNRAGRNLNTNFALIPWGSPLKRIGGIGEMPSDKDKRSTLIADLHRRKRVALLALKDDVERKLPGAGGRLEEFIRQTEKYETGA